MKLDLNCDLGEGEPLQRTRDLMQWISSANVACGGHAGDADSMRECVRLAQAFDVNLGAHPGPWSRADKGRGEFTITTIDLKSLLLEQVGALQRIAAEEVSEVHHIKLHGALYHAVEQRQELAEAYVEFVGDNWKSTRIIAFAAGRVARFARETGVPVWEEAFADRGYLKSGDLVPRHEVGAVLEDVELIANRVRRLGAGNEILSQCGAELKIQCDTVCVHSDSPNALEIVQRLSRQLQQG